MPRGAGMFRGVFVRRIVAAERRPAGLARPQVDPLRANLYALLAFENLGELNLDDGTDVRAGSGIHDLSFNDSCTPAMAMLPSPTAAAQRFTEPERTSPTAKIPGRLVSSATGARPWFAQPGAAATSAPVWMNPFLSRKISAGNHSVQGVAPIIEKTAGVSTERRSPVFLFSNSTASRTALPVIRRTVVQVSSSMFSRARTRRDK